MEVICTVCDRPCPQPKRGYRLYHDECKALHDDLERLKKHLAQIAGGTHKVQLSPKQVAQLRYDLFCLTSELPRLRDSRGRFVSAGVSDSYDRETAARKARAAARKAKAEAKLTASCRLAKKGEPPCRLTRSKAAAADASNVPVSAGTAA